MFEANCVYLFGIVFSFSLLGILGFTIIDSCWLLWLYRAKALQVEQTRKAMVLVAFYFWGAMVPTHHISVLDSKAFESESSKIFSNNMQPTVGAHIPALCYIDTMSVRY